MERDALAHQGQRHEIGGAGAGLIDAPAPHRADVGGHGGEIEGAREAVAPVAPLHRLGDHELLDEVRDEERVALGARGEEIAELLVDVEEAADEAARGLQIERIDAHAVGRGNSNIRS